QERRRPLFGKTAVAFALLIQRHYLGRTRLLTITLGLLTALPLTLSQFAERTEVALQSRAVKSPLLAGAPGSRYDLSLRALYFRGAALKVVPYRMLRMLQEERRGVIIPLHLRLSAGGAPLVGTSPEYYERRGLLLERGTPPLLTGQVALGASAAARLGLQLGDELMSDQANLYDLSASYPLKMKVVGLFKESGEPEDDVVFTSLETAWIIEGIGHGHQSDTSRSANEGSTVISYGAAQVREQQVNSQNRGSFHFHGDPEDRPLSAFLIFPTDQRAETLLYAKQKANPALLFLRPREVVKELLQVFTKLKLIFTTGFLFVLSLVMLLTVLVLTLSWNARREERVLLCALGASRTQQVLITTAEFLSLTILTAFLTLIAIALFTSPLAPFSLSLFGL
ncbi:MAG: hypothetical protein VYD19_08035, partial [Myxococcota bacterium]|nr:hypothetical protein [Myxococcota bacterium]